MNISENIQGADLERLNDCIKFACENKLTITPHTQCGVNQTSGNVWLWDEDWAGCIYQDIGFSGACFSWSCPYCGCEYDEGDLQGCEDRNDLCNLFDGCHECKADEINEYIKESEAK